MNNDLKIRKEYEIVLKKLFCKKTFLITPHKIIPNEYVLNDKGFDKKLIDEFQIYGLKADEIETTQCIFFKNPLYVKSFNLFFYRISNKDGLSLNAVKIMDVAVVPKYRKHEIGKQLMLILDEIARENNIKFIVGELQNDRKDEPLEKRKDFFMKNGFEVWKDERVRFSGWVIKKAIK